MGIINRRNAVLGWGVWKALKGFSRMKMRQAVPGRGDHVGLNKSAIGSIFAGVTAALGALWFWRKTSDDTTKSS